jgi:succinate dehydrogenase / fumarate reductase membrane anchor subunit
MQIIHVKKNLNINAWKYMRLSGILLIPLVWIHTIMQTLIVGSENIDLNYVTARWMNAGWRVYDFLLLAFAFSHGVNGLRQVLTDFASGSKMRKIINVLMLAFWILLSLIGTVGIIGGARQP